jgi:hypothetical protein
MDIFQFALAFFVLSPVPSSSFGMRPVNAVPGLEKT